MSWLVDGGCYNKFFQKAMLETSVQYLDIMHRVQLLNEQYFVSLFVHLLNSTFFSIFVHLKALLLPPKVNSNI